MNTTNTTNTTEVARLRAAWDRACKRLDRAVAIINDSGDASVHGVTDAVIARLYRTEQRAQARYVAAAHSPIKIGELVRVTFRANLLCRPAPREQHEGEIAYWQEDALGWRAMVYPACLMFPAAELARAAVR